MNKLLLVVLSLVLANTSFAQEGSIAKPNVVPLSESNTLYADDEFHVDGVASVYVTNGENAAGSRDTKARLRGFDIRFSQRLMKQLWAELTLRLDAIDSTNGSDIGLDKDVVRSVSITKEFSDILGAEVVGIRLGKSKAAFGGNVERMPLRLDDPIYSLVDSKTSQVVGATFYMQTKDFNQLVKGILLEVSAFDSQRNEFDSLNSYSARVSGNLGEKTRASVSFTDLDNDGQYASASLEHRFNDQWAAYGEIVKQTKSDSGADKQQITSVGATYKPFQSGEFVIQASIIEDLRKEYGVGYLWDTTVGRIGTQVKHLDNDSGDDSEQVGLSWEYGFSNARTAAPAHVDNYLPSNR